MLDQPPTTRSFRPLIALSCPKPHRLTAFTAREAERRRPGFAFDARDKRADFVAAYPELDEVCERIHFGWDYAVGDWSRNPRWVMIELARSAQPPKHGDEPDLRSSSLCEVVEHLLAIHHRPLRWEMNRLDILIQTLAETHPHQRDIQALASGFALLRDSLLVHLLQEEMEAFPLCIDLESRAHDRDAVLAAGEAAPLHFMAAGHLETGDDLARLCDLAERAGLGHDPDTALVIRGLAAMHDDLTVHTNIENEVLLPAALFTCDLLACRRPRPASVGH